LVIVWDDCGMAKRYRPVARDRAFLFPPDMREWLPRDHPVWLVITVAEDHLDTSAFRAARRTGGAGAAGYDPDMLLALLVWAYARKVTSSRRIEELCRTDVAFMVICGRDAPDHVTVARFRADFPGAVGEFFAEVLGLCAALGMGKLGAVALDGMKIAASASKSANRGEDTLRKLAAGAVAAHAAAADAAEDEVLGQGRRGDEVPAEAADPRTRSQKIAAALRAARVAAALAGLEAARRAGLEEQEREERRGQACLDDVAAGKLRPGSPPAPAQMAAARARLDRVTAARQAKAGDWERRNAAKLAARGRALPGCPPVPVSQFGLVLAARVSLERAEAAAGRRATAKAAGKGPPVRNITDPDSRLMPVRGGAFIQGYNAQNVACADGLIIATELTADPAGTPWSEPMLARAQDAAAFITARQPPAAGGPGSGIGLILADAGYLSEDNLSAAGPDRLIATGKHRNLEKAARGTTSGPARSNPLIAAMAARLATAEGITARRQRGHIAETPHGNIKQNMGFRQLTMRGKAKADAERRFACAVRNLFKAITAGHLTTTALRALAGQGG
jgi:transposase